MGTFIAITSPVFDLLIAPWGHHLVVVDLVLWSVLSAIVALFVYKRISNQSGIAAAKERIKLHLLEVRLWRDNLQIVARATWRIIVANAAYLGHNVLPMVVLAPVFVLVLSYLVAHFAYAPAAVGSIGMLHVTLDPETMLTGLRPTDVDLSLPDGIELDAPPVRTPEGEIYWRLRASQPGDHVLTLSAGEARLDKGLAVGGAHRKVPVLRTKSLMGLLYPGESPIPAASPFLSVELSYPERALWVLPPGEMGILILFLILSVVFGFALKDAFGVTL